MATGLSPKPISLLPAVLHRAFLAGKVGVFILGVRKVQQYPLEELSCTWQLVQTSKNQVSLLEKLVDWHVWQPLY